VGGTIKLVFVIVGMMFLFVTSGKGLPGPMAAGLHHADWYKQLVHNVRFSVPVSGTSSCNHNALVFNDQYQYNPLVTNDTTTAVWYAHST
jgi:hypothetical protein